MLPPAILRRCGAAAIILLALVACTSTGPARQPQATILLLAYTPNTEVRSAFETQLRNDLAGHDIAAVVSHDRLPDFAAITSASTIEQANAAGASLVLTLRRIAGQVDPQNPGGGAPSARQHLTLADLFADPDVGAMARMPAAQRPVVAVNLYLLTNGGSRLFWSGYSWIDTAGGVDTAIAEAAGLIASNMASGRDELRRRGVIPGGQ